MAADIALRAKLIRTDIGMDSASAMSKLLGMSPNVRIPRMMGIDSTRSWAWIPRHRGHRFHASGS
ncbi:hypothetical protein, partial [Camelimonas lactis]